MLENNTNAEKNELNRDITAEEGVEFVFGVQSNDEGCLIDFADDDSVLLESCDAIPKVSFETVEAETECADEFSVPENYDSSRIFGFSGTKSDAPKLHSTYLPRFTEVSENYRMKDDPRPKTIQNTADKPKSAVPSSSANKIDPTAEIEGAAYLDPTAEIDKNIKVQGAVKVSPKPDSVDIDLESSSRVFKFNVEENEPELKMDSSEPLAAPIEDSFNESDKASDVPMEPSFEEEGEKNYVIPDPVEEESVHSSYLPVNTRRAMQDVEAPMDVGDRFIKPKKDAASEYVAHSQRDTFVDKFLDSIMSVKVRFFAAAALAVLLLTLENMFAFGVDVPDLFGLQTVPGAMALIDIQFIVCLYILSIPETVFAVKRLTLGKAAPEINLTVSFAVLILYSVLISTVYTPQQYPLFGSVFSIFVLAAIGATYFRRTADFTAFKLISLNGEKLVVDNKLTRTLEKENAALDGIIEEHKSKTARMFKTSHVSDFFARAEIPSEDSNCTLTVLACSLGIALVTAVIAYFIPGGALSAISAFLRVFILATPALTLISHKITYYHASEEAESELCAVIGESSLIDFSGTDVITFEDTEVFGREDVKIQRIMLYGRNDNLSKALGQMSALFMNVGGPLDFLFSNSLDRKCHPADTTIVEDGGVCGTMGSHDILAGTMEYMLSKGVRIPEQAGANTGRAESVRTIYLAEDGKIYAKFYVSYSFSEEFSMLLPVLYDEGIVPLIYTRDPNITESFVRMLTAGSDRIRILKKTSASDSENTVYRKISSGMVSLGDKTSLINTILMTKKHAKLQKKIKLWEICLMCAGAAFGVVLSVLGLNDYPIALCAWQAAFCAALHIVSKKTFSFVQGRADNGIDEE